MTDTECEEFLEALRCNNAHGIGRGFISLTRFIEGSLSRSVGDVELVRDLANETCLRVHLRFDDYKGTGRFLGWVRSIAHNVSVEHFRKSAHCRESPSDFSETDSQLSIELVTTDEPAFSIDTTYYLSCLTDEERRVFVLWHFEKSTPNEIADLLKKKDAKQIYRLLASARTKLADLMRRDGYRDGSTG